MLNKKKMICWYSMRLAHLRCLTSLQGDLNTLFNAVSTCPSWAAPNVSSFRPSHVYCNLGQPTHNFWIIISLGRIVTLVNMQVNCENCEKGCHSIWFVKPSGCCTCSRFSSCNGDGLTDIASYHSIPNTVGDVLVCEEKETSAKPLRPLARCQRPSNIIVDFHSRSVIEVRLKTRSTCRIL